MRHKKIIDPFLTPRLPHDVQTANVAKENAQSIDIGKGIETGAELSTLFGQEDLAGVLEIVGGLVSTAELKYQWEGAKEIPNVKNDKLTWYTFLDLVSEHPYDFEGTNNIDNPRLLSRRSPKTGDFDGYIDTEMQFKLFEYYDHKTWNADQYGTHGYVKSFVLYIDPITGIREEQYYYDVSAVPADIP